MPWTTDRQRVATDHLLDTARRFRVEVYWEPDAARWQAHVSSRQVWVPLPDGYRAYMVGLHELGHVASQVARRWGHRYDEPGGTVLVEAAAWAWAAMTASPDIMWDASEADWAEVVHLFGGYLWNATMVEPVPVGSRVRL